MVECEVQGPKVTTLVKRGRGMQWRRACAAMCCVVVVAPSMGAVCLLPGVAKASEASKRDVDRIVFLLERNGTTVARTLLSNLPVDLKVTDFRMNHPHQVVNPEKKEATFAGVRVESLLQPLFADAGFSQANPPGNEAVVSFVGRDSYTVSIPYGDVVAGGSCLVGFKDSKKLGWRAGAPFLAFSNTSKAAYLADSSWWAWWVSAVVVGNPPAELKVNTKTFTFDDLKRACSVPLEGDLNYPRGKRKTEPPRKTAGKLMACSLDSLGLKPQAKGQGYAAEFLTGQVRKISDPRKHRVVFGFNGSGIPTPLGGPVQLCDVDEKKECSYFLTSLRSE